MASTHKQTSTTKSSRDQIVIPDMSEAWRAIIQSAKLDNLDKLHAEGWMTVQDYVDACNAEGIEMDTRRAKHILSTNPDVESKPVSILYSGQTRKLNVYRPKVGR